MIPIPFTFSFHTNFNFNFNFNFKNRHGNLSPMEQKSVFEVARKGELKIVVSTNVAEASVTLPDVTVVIDSCRVKEIDFDVEKQMTALIMKKASKDSLRQRRGRAGRVQVNSLLRRIGGEKKRKDREYKEK